MLSTAGVSVYKHYCGDFLASLSFYTPAESCSDMAIEGCEMKKMDCCDDESEFYQADLDLIKKDAEQYRFSFFELKLYSSNQLASAINSNQLSQKNYRGPPTNGPPRYLLFSRWIDYG